MEWGIIFLIFVTPLAMGAGVVVGLLEVIQNFAGADRIFWIWRPFVNPKPRSMGDPSGLEVLREAIRLDPGLRRRVERMLIKGYSEGR